MKLKMSDIITLSNFYETIKDKKLSLKVAYKFSKLNSNLEKEINFYQEKFSDIINEFAIRDENGELVYTEDQTSIKITEGREMECNIRINELRDLEVDLPDIKFTIDELENFDFTINEMNCLMPLIEE